MKIINVKELKNISISELIEIIKQKNKLLFELIERNYTLKLVKDLTYFMYIEPIYDVTFFKDLKMVNDVNEKNEYFYERFNDIILFYRTFPETETIKNLAIIVKHLIDIYNKNFTTKKELLLQII